jgi:hypothetical protein
VNSSDFMAQPAAVSRFGRMPVQGCIGNAAQTQQAFQEPAAGARPHQGGGGQSNSRTAEGVPSPGRRAPGCPQRGCEVPSCAKRRPCHRDKVKAPSAHCTIPQCALSGLPQGSAAFRLRRCFSHPTGRDHCVGCSVDLHHTELGVLSIVVRALCGRLLRSDVCRGCTTSGEQRSQDCKHDVLHG